MRRDGQSSEQNRKVKPLAGNLGRSNTCRIPWYWLLVKSTNRQRNEPCMATRVKPRRALDALHDQGEAAVFNDVVHAAPLHIEAYSTDF